MTKEQMIRKFTSRKFWLALVGFVTALMIAFNMSDGDIEKVAAIIGAFGSLIAYILGESYIDGKREGGDIYVTDATDE